MRTSHETHAMSANENSAYRKYNGCVMF